MKLYNTLSRSLEEYTPLNQDVVRIYSCGPTVYDHIHIGNLSAFIMADTLRRALTAHGYKTKHVMNFTDVDDKTIRRSHEKYPDMEPKQALAELTEYYSQLFLEDMQLVGNTPSNYTFVKATDPEVIQGMQDLISELHQQGFAYIAEDGVYFSIDAYKKSGKVYGQLSDITSSSTSEERIRNDEYDKESAHDFALWKKQKRGEPAWQFELDDTDLTGRPGWHIECSVMSSRTLGQPFDIHTGGIDLIFPHHENEIAQSTAGKDDATYAKYFVHNEHILVDGKKMSKSLNNFYTLKDIIDKGYDPLAFRLLVLQSRYYSQAHFSWENLAAAQNRLKNLRNIAELRHQVSTQTEYAQDTSIERSKTDMLDAIADNLNTSAVLETIASEIDEFDTHGVMAEAQTHFIGWLQTIDDILGLQLLETTPDISEGQKALLSDREQARGDKDWAKSDALRSQLTEQGIGLRDTDHGAIWYRL